MARGKTGGLGGGAKQAYSADELEKKCDAYFSFCAGQAEDGGKPRRPTRAGLCLWLDLSEDTLGRYESGKKPYEAVAAPIKKALLKIRDDLEQHGASMDIFRLKQPCYGGFVDRPAIDAGGAVDVHITFGDNAGNLGK